MATEYKLSYTAKEIDETLGKVAENEANIGLLQQKIDNIPEPIQGDWNQSDETAIDYIKNKPFYDYTETFVDNITVNNGDTLDINILDDIGEEGEIVTVVWDGVPLEQVVRFCHFKLKNDRWSRVYYTIGNQSYLNDSLNTFEDTGEEYLIKYSEGTSFSTISCDDKSHTIAIIKQSIGEIDDKFLPNNVVYYEEVSDENEENVIETLCFDQLSLSFDGATLYLKFGNTVLSQVDISTEIITCTGISLDRVKISVTDDYIGTNYTLSPTVLPNNCTQAVKWSTNNESVATVSNGVVSLTGVGEAIITATCGNYSAACDVVVESTVIDVEIINGIYNTNTTDGTVSYVNSSNNAVINPFIIKLDSTIDYTVSMNNADYQTMIIGYNMTDSEADYYIDNAGVTETFAGKLTYWGDWKSADGTVHEINQSNCPYLQVLINKADGSSITSADLQTIKDTLVIKKVYELFEVGISFGINAGWNANNGTYTTTLSENAARGYSKYNGRNIAIPVEPLTTYAVDFSDINDSNYIVGYQFAKSDGVKIAELSGWGATQTFTLTTPAEAVGVVFNLKYGEAGTTTITAEMAEALTNVFTFEKVVE